MRTGRAAGLWKRILKAMVSDVPLKFQKVAGAPCTVKRLFPAPADKIGKDLGKASGIVQVLLTKRYDFLCFKMK